MKNNKNKKNKNKNMKKSSARGNFSPHSSVAPHFASQLRNTERRGLRVTAYFQWEDILNILNGNKSLIFLIRIYTSYFQ